jgi:hypothetical protein
MSCAASRVSCAAAAWSRHPPCRRPQRRDSARRRASCRRALLRTACDADFHLAPADLHLAEMSPVNGIGYSKTLLAWLYLLDAQHRPFVTKYGRAFHEGFRMFYIACAEAFAANQGNEFMCGYYTFVKR